MSTRLHHFSYLFCLETFTCLSSSKLSDVWTWSAGAGQCLRPINNHSGPYHQEFSSLSLDARTPLDPMSAGFSSPGQCAQSPLFVNFKISLTLWRTNCFHSPLFCIQQSAVLLSSQNLTSLTFRDDSKAFWTVFINLARLKADISSSLGMVRLFKGATLVFETMRLARVPNEVLQTRYTIAQYALLLASPNPCREQSKTSAFGFG